MPAKYLTTFADEKSSGKDFVNNCFVWNISENFYVSIKLDFEEVSTRRFPANENISPIFGKR